MRRDCAVTSGPMPSPPTTATLIMFDETFMRDPLSKMNPRPLGAVGGLKGANFGVALQRELDFIEALQEPGAAARIDLKAMHLSGWRGDRLLLQVDRHAACALTLLDFNRKTIDDLLVDDDGQDSVLETVGEKDIAKTRADDGADAIFLERPHRALARGAATEIRPSDQDFRVAIRLAVEDELRIVRSVRQIAQ